MVRSFVGMARHVRVQAFCQAERLATFLALKRLIARVYRHVILKSALEIESQTAHVAYKQLYLIIISKMTFDSTVPFQS